MRYKATLSVKQADILILGLCVGGIGTLRMLKRCSGYNVYGIVFDHGNELGRFTSLCTVLKWPDPKQDNDGFMKELIRWSEQREKIVVFATRDEEIYWLAKHADALPANILYYRNSFDLVECLDNKVSSSELVSSYGIRVPSLCLITQKMVPSNFTFPCIIKPSAVPPKDFPLKNLLVKNIDEFYSALELYPCLINASILQEYIPGGDDQVYQCTALAGRLGKILGSIEIRKLRQYPVGRGIACFAHTLLHRELSDMCDILVRKSGIRGFISVEFKKDYRSSQWFFIEANLRMPGYNSVFACTDVNFAQIYISDLLGEYNNPDKLENSEKYYWMREELDLANIVNKQVGIGILQWLRDLMHTDTFAFWHNDDLMPGLANIVRIIKSFLNKVKQIFFAKKICHKRIV